MIQVDLIRRYALKQVNALRIFISMLPEREHTALARLHGVEGARTATAIADFVLVQLGHVPPEAERDGNPAKSPTFKAARSIMPDDAALPPKENHNGRQAGRR